MSTATIEESDSEDEDRKPEFKKLISVTNGNRATFNMDAVATIDERILD